MTILTPPQRKISLASMALGALLMTSLSTENANASLWERTKCNIKCSNNNCAKIPQTLIDCAEQCDYSSIEKCVSQNCSKLDPTDKERLALALQKKLSDLKEKMVAGGSPLKPGAALGTGAGAAAMAGSSSKEQKVLMKEIDILKGAMERCGLPLTSNTPSTPGTDTSPINPESEPSSPVASHEGTSSSSKQPLNLAEDAVKQRDNLKKTGSPDTPPSKEATPRPVSPRLKSASPTHVTQPTQPARKTAVEGSAEDLKKQLKPSDFTMLGSLSNGKTPDQILDIIKQKPGLFTEEEKVVKYLEKLKEEEGATPPAHEEKGAAEKVAHTPPPAAHIPPPPSDLLSPPGYAPPPPPSSVEKATPPKRGVVPFLTPPPRLVLPPSQGSGSASQNMTE